MFTSCGGVVSTITKGAAGGAAGAGSGRGSRRRLGRARRARRRGARGRARARAPAGRAALRERRLRRRSGCGGCRRLRQLLRQRGMRRQRAQDRQNEQTALMNGSPLVTCYSSSASPATPIDSGDTAIGVMSIARRHRNRLHHHAPRYSTARSRPASRRSCWPAPPLAAARCVTTGPRRTTVAGVTARAIRGRRCAAGRRPDPGVAAVIAGGVTAGPPLAGSTGAGRRHPLHTGHRPAPPRQRPPPAAATPSGRDLPAPRRARAPPRGAPRAAPPSVIAARRVVDRGIDRLRSCQSPSTNPNAASRCRTWRRASDTRHFTVPTGTFSIAATSSYP